MNNFLDKARDLTYAIQDQRWIDASKLVFKAISALQRVHSKSELNLFNLESLFTTFEMAASIQQLADLEQSDISKLVESLQTLIVFTLDSSMCFQIGSQGFIPSDSYKRFAELFSRFHQPNESIAIITFNYDVGIELALHYLGQEFSYCLDGKQQRTSGISLQSYNVMPLLKLHGSINWGTTTGSEPDAPIIECPITWLPNTAYAQQRTARSKADPSQTYSLQVGSRFFTWIREAGHPQIREAPVIVPPGMYKTEYQNSLRQVWRAAARELADAEYIYVIGYSLPSTDFFFHNLYALGTVSSTILRRFTVIDTNPEIESRFKGLLGPAARDRFRLYPYGFEGAMNNMNIGPWFWE